MNLESTPKGTDFRKAMHFVSNLVRSCAQPCFGFWGETTFETRF